MATTGRERPHGHCLTHSGTVGHAAFYNHVVSSELEQDEGSKRPSCPVHYRLLQVTLDQPCAQPSPRSRFNWRSRFLRRTLNVAMMRRVLVLLLLLAWLPADTAAKSYSSGGRSFSSGGSSTAGRSSGSSGSRSSSTGRSYSSGAGRTYSSGSSPSRSSNSSSSPGSSRSYSSGSSSSKPVSKTPPAPSPQPSGKAPGAVRSFSFDTAAARAQKEAASKRDFSAWKDDSARSQASPAGGSEKVPGSAMTDRASRERRSYADQEYGPYGGSSRRSLVLPTPQDHATRPIRIQRVYTPYYSRPLVVYNDPYSSFFWWWLLDRSLEDRAAWAYHHRADMDAARYQALLATDTNLETRVRELEGQQLAVNPRHVPTGLDADLMYSDHTVRQAYRTRPTVAGRLGFWLILVPAMAATLYFLVWLIFVKRWQTSTA